MTDPDPVVVCQAVIDRLSPLMLDWHWFLSEPARPKLNPIPYVLVEIVPAKGADFVEIPARWFVQLVLYADGSDHEASLRFMAPFVGTKGVIIKALRDFMCDYDDDLSTLSKGGILPTMLSGLKLVRKSGTRLRTATITAGIGTN